MFNLDLVFTDAIVVEFIAAVYGVSAVLSALGLIVMHICIMLRSRASPWHVVAEILLGATFIGAAHAAFVVAMLWLASA